MRPFPIYIMLVFLLFSCGNNSTGQEQSLAIDRDVLVDLYNATDGANWTNKTLDEEYRDQTFSPCPRYWVSQQESNIVQCLHWLLVFKDITASTNVLTMIAAIVPQVGCGHTLPVLVPIECDFDGKNAACLLSNLNSFCFDYIAHQKVQATHLTWYIVEQLPVIAPADFDRQFGNKTARDLGYDGAPFIWDEKEHRHLRARLDALYFHLYCLSREDA
ncbi:MAG: hypothetical protein OXH16_01660 [Gemmatimonadetes bacterium]|nr:hypothetical protein [Gemmatimonadota bacterium]